MRQAEANQPQLPQPDTTRKYSVSLARRNDLLAFVGRQGAPAPDDELDTHRVRKSFFFAKGAGSATDRVIALASLCGIPTVVWERDRLTSPFSRLVPLLQLLKLCVTWRILPIPPTPAVFDECVIEVGAIQHEHVCKGVFVLVLAVGLDGHVFLKGEGRSGVLGAACRTLT